MKKSILIAIPILLGGVAIGVGLFKGLQNLMLPLGSVNIANEYHATTTYAGSNAILNITTSSIFFDKTSGALGSVIITRAAGTAFDIYDATTTVRTSRDASMTTNTIRLASFPANAATGTYTFDEVFYNGLIVVFDGVNIPTTTITWR